MIASIESSALSEDDKNVWRAVLAKATAEQITELTSLLEGNHDLLAILTDNLKKKQAAVTSGDPVAVDAIVKEERELIKQNYL